jgi:hypothetical protein
MPSSRLGFRNFIGQPQIQKTESPAIVTSESDGRKKDMKVVELRGPESEMTVRKKSLENFPLLKPRPKGRCKA